MNALTTTIAAAILAISDDWKLVVACLHFSGEFHPAIDHRTAVRVRELADGFGSLRGPKSEEKWACLWDWSHIRDSSPEAVAKMAAALRKVATGALRSEVARTTDPRVVEWRRVAVELAEIGDFDGSRRCELEARKLEAVLAA